MRHQLFGSRLLYEEAGSRLSSVVEHGRDPVHSSSLECRCRLWRFAKPGALVSLGEEEHLYLAADNHLGRRRGMNADAASRDQISEAVSVEDLFPAVDASMRHREAGQEGHVDCVVAIHKVLEACERNCRTDQ